jgi:heme a synthase
MTSEVLSNNMSIDLSQNEQKESQEGLALRVFSKIVCFFVFLLIFKGSLVTSNNAGLAVPDWPTTFGENMFLYPPSEWTGGVFFEHVHRLLASFVGFLTLVLCVWICFVEKRFWVKVLSLVALVAVILQGVLGGLTVLYLLPVWVSSSHAVLAQTFFALTLLIAYSLSLEYKTRVTSSEQNQSVVAYRISLIFILLLFIQLALGAVMRHSQAGLAVPDFPTIGGQWIPMFNAEMFSEIARLRQEIEASSVTSAQVLIHVMHRIGAIFVTLFAVGMFYVLRKTLSKNMQAAAALYSKIHSTLNLILVVIFAQFTLGIFTVLSIRNPWIASAHVLFGALLLAFSVLLALRLYPMPFSKSRFSSN